MKEKTNGTSANISPIFTGDYRHDIQKMVNNMRADDCFRQPSKFASQ